MKRVNFHDNKAVSPLIATIILIVITIVLAATLYVALVNYTSNSTKSVQAPAVEISATLTKNCYVNNITNNQFPYPVCYQNNTIFYELKINSINGCNDNISTRFLEFNIQFKNSSGSFSCSLKPYIHTFGRSHMPRCKITSSGKSGPAGTFFDIVLFHPVLHMTGGSIYLFQPIFEKQSGWVYLPQNQIYSIEIINFENNTNLASINLS